MRRAARRTAKRFQRYIARALADGSATAGPIFDEMVTHDRAVARAGRRSPPRSARRRPQDQGRAGHGHGGRHPAAPRARCPGRSAPTCSDPKATGCSPSGCSTSTPTRSLTRRPPPRPKQDSTTPGQSADVRHGNAILPALPWPWMISSSRSPRRGVPGSRRDARGAARSPRPCGSASSAGWRRRT